MHLPAGGSGVDYNRAGTPLMEIVTAFPPDITDSDEAKEYLQQLRQILLYLGVCDGKMEEGSLRCEPNISVRIEGAEKLGTKTELKNLNSFRSVQLGVGFEVRRQIATLEHGGKVVQETRGWNEQKEASYAMRVKEAENDYRYFPDPDLVPMVFEEAYIEGLRAALPELPLAKVQRYQDVLGLSAYDATLLSADRDWAGFFEDAVSQGGDPKAVCNWMNSEFARMLNDADLSALGSNVSPAHIVQLTKLIADGTINGKMAKEIFAEVFKSGKSPADIVSERGATQLTDTGEIVKVVQNVFGVHAEVVDKYRSGNVGVTGFLVGQVMRQTGGRANPQIVQTVVKEELEKLK
jgi:aspartyl-tRNA(Asn)/glutamyl-tRNA(Gln) amidotransferase subunit B